MPYRRITVEPEQPDSLPNVSRRVLPLSVSPAERREIEKEQKKTCQEPSCHREDDAKGESSRVKDRPGD